MKAGFATLKSRASLGYGYNKLLTTTIKYSEMWYLIYLLNIYQYYYNTCIVFIINENDRLKKKR